MSKTYWITTSLLWATLIFRLTTMPQVATVSNTFLQQIMMSAAHFGFFGLLTLFIYLALRPMKQARVWAISSVIFYGLMIELIQRGIPGRTSDPVDWVLDILGAFSFMYLVRKYYLV